MAEANNIARPYARAVFELARQQDDLAGWSDALEKLSAVVADDSVVAVIRSPRVGNEDAAGVVVAAVALVSGVAVDELADEFVNLVRLLAQNRRLALLPNIARGFALLRAEAERVIEAQMTTAAEINPQQREQFTEALQSRLGRKVKLEFGVDQELVGGAVVRAGDWVIDGSVRAQLEQLVGALRA